MSTVTMEIPADLTKADLPKPSTEWLRVGMLAVDHSIQRNLVKARVSSLEKVFDIDLVGIITVSCRGEGKFYLLDGQHRKETMLRRGLSDVKVECRVYRGLTRDQEFYLFYGLNNEHIVQAAAKFRARAGYGESTANEISRIVRKNGLEISTTTQEGTVSAVVALEAVYTGSVMRKSGVYPEILSATIQTLLLAFDAKKNTTMNGELIKGVGMVMHRYGQTLTPDALAKKLSSAHSSGAAGLLISGKGYRETHKTTIANGVAIAIVTEYNKGRTRGRLPLWQNV